MPKPIQEIIQERIIVADGAIGTMLYSKGAYINRCFDEMNLSAPNVVRDIHSQYARAGAELLETNTFGANPLKLHAFGIDAQCEEINRRGAEIAREVAGKDLWVGGSIGPLGKPLSPIGKIDKAEAQDLFRPQ